MFRVVGATAAFDRSSKRLHPGKCRFCGRPTDELLTRLDDFGVRLVRGSITLTDDARRAEREWQDLKPNVRFARLREAQETNWHEEIDL